MIDSRLSPSLESRRIRSQYSLIKKIVGQDGKQVTEAQKLFMKEVHHAYFYYLDPFNPTRDAEHKAEPRAA